MNVCFRKAAARYVMAGQSPEKAVRGSGRLVNDPECCMAENGGWAQESVSWRAVARVPFLAIQSTFNFMVSKIISSRGSLNLCDRQ